MQLQTAAGRIWPKGWTISNICERGRDRKGETDWEKLREMEKEEGRGQGKKKKRFTLPMTNQS